MPCQSEEARSFGEYNGVSTGSHASPVCPCRLSRALCAWYFYSPKLSLIGDLAPLPVDGCHIYGYHSIYLSSEIDYFETFFLIAK